MIVVDFLDNDLLNKAIAGSEIVYNFAALADLDHARHKPVETININILGNWPAPRKLIELLCYDLGQKPVD